VGGRKSKVLIVDDDPGTCETLADILEESGCATATVRSGEECIERLRKESFDVVLMDIKMPGMDGVETFRRIRGLSRELKVIMMTAYAMDNLVAEAVKEGAFSVVHKPLDLDMLLKLVKG